MINVSTEAAKKVAHLMQEEGKDVVSAFVRVGVKSGGCSGLSYDMGFVDKPEEGDQLFEDQGVKVLVEKKSIGTHLNRCFYIIFSYFYFFWISGRTRCTCSYVVNVTFPSFYKV